MQILFIAFAALMAVLNIAAIYTGVIALFTFKKRRPYPDAAPETRFAVVIPARNEERVIGKLIDRLNAQHYPRDRFDIYVAINNCTDRTGEIAAAKGAKLLHCDNTHCKGDVLHQALARLMPMGYDAYAFFDADNQPDAEFLQKMNDALAAGERVCKGRLKASNPYDSWVSGGYGLYHALMEWIYSRPHAAAGMSSNLVGTGFVVHRDVMDELGGWNTETICEDSEFAAICARIGVRIAWVYEALSYDEQVTDFKLSLIQRVRWCRGMVMTARRYTKDLLRRDCPNRKVALDFAMVLILSHTAPLSMLLSILSLPFQNRLMLLMTLGSLALSIVGMIFLAILLCILGGYSVRRMLPTILLYPLYTASWFPLQLAALFLPIRSWKPIPHQGGEVEDLAA